MNESLRCATCGESHDISFMDPAFGRPDALLAIPAEDRELLAKHDDDLCIIRDSDAPNRFFLRTVLPVVVTDRPEPISWGIWVELAEEPWQIVLDRWKDPKQSEQLPLDGHVANRVPQYPNTLGLHVRVQLVSPTKRPTTSFPAEVEHAFASDCRQGISAHQAKEWLDCML